jgi:LysR family transcriptional regulator (chromosome initiation inhibitor)
LHDSFKPLKDATFVIRCKGAALPSAPASRLRDGKSGAVLARSTAAEQPSYSRSVGAYKTAIELGLVRGMVPEQHLAQRPTLQELMPGATVDVALYLQHWAREAPSAQRLTQAVKTAAALHLRQA